MKPNLIHCLLFFCLLAVTVLSNAQIRPTPAAERMKKLENKRLLVEKSVVNHVQFRNIGPNIMSGRVSDLDVNPEDPTEFYVSYASGGLWHTTNNGHSFAPVFDSAETLTIGDFAVDWKTGTIWVGTGEVNSSRSSYAGTGMYKSRDRGKTWEYAGLPESHHIGKVQLHPNNPDILWVAVLGHLYSSSRERGVFKTTDGGRSWKHTLYIDDNTGVVDLDINPSNPDEIYAAAWYRTRRAWNFEESGPSSGIYKSTDGGESWKLVSTPGSGFLTGRETGRIGLAVFPADPRIIYAVVDNQAPRPDTSRLDTLTYALDQLKNLSIEEFALLDENRLDTFLKRNRMAPRYTARMVKDMVAQKRIRPTSLYDYLYIRTGFEGTPVGAEIYRSSNSGATWEKMNEEYLTTFFTYGYYFGKIYISPYNAGKLFLLGVFLHLSTDDGRTWKTIDKPNVHADHHALWINPRRDSHIIDGNDGGVNISYDDGENWFKANMPPVGQFYSVTVDNAKPYNIYGGLQDNGVWWTPSVTPVNRFRGSGLGLVAETEKNLGGGDGMQVQVDPRDNATTYYGHQFGNYARRNRITMDIPRSIKPVHELGEKPLRFNWQTPILLSPHTPEILYLGSNRLYRSFNRGDTMIPVSGDLTRGEREGDVPYGTITAISESPIRFGLIYTGTDDGNVHVSADAGHSWQLISGRRKKGISLPQELWVSRIVASQHRPSRVYLALNGYRNDDFLPYLYSSEDEGRTWNIIGSDLPAEPVNVVREDPVNENIIYVGTDGGLYISFNRGRSFMAWNAGLPWSVPVHDIAIQIRDNEIILGTHGRSIYIAKLEEVQRVAASTEP